MKLHFFGCGSAFLILQWEIHLPGLRWTDACSWWTAARQYMSF